MKNRKKRRDCIEIFVSPTLSLPVSRWAGANTDLPSNSNISKTVVVSTAFTKESF